MPVLGLLAGTDGRVREDIWEQMVGLSVLMRFVVPFETDLLVSRVGGVKVPIAQLHGVVIEVLCLVR